MSHTGPTERRVLWEQSQTRVHTVAEVNRWWSTEASGPRSDQLDITLDGSFIILEDILNIQYLFIYLLA